MAKANMVRSSLRGHVEVGGKKGGSRRHNGVKGLPNFGRRDTGKVN
jgi:hypothetical protein